jgi:glutamyl-Q tRNA(Asp) synthetase
MYVWGLARALGGRVVLRIEDHDGQRARPEFEASILEDLGWLGLDRISTVPATATGHPADSPRMRSGSGIVERCMQGRSSA